MSAKVLFYADGHLFAPGPGGFNAKEGLAQNAIESLRSLRMAVDAANEAEVDLMVCPGDLFDSGRPTPEMVARTEAEFARLNPKTKALLLDGNHDQQGVLSGHRTAIQSYFAERPWCAAAFADPGVFELDGLQIASLPWPRVSSTNARGATSEALAASVDNLAAQVRDGGLSALAGHITVTECTFDSGKRGSELHMVTSALEASIPSATLEQGPWAAVRLGHIHKRQQITDKVGYVGSPYKVSFGEEHDDKGVEIVTFEEDGTVDIAFQRFDVRQLIKVDLVGAPGQRQVAARPGDIVRIVTDTESLERAEAIARTVQASGASAHVHRVPEQMVAMAREAAYDTEMAPDEAMKAFLDKREVPTGKRAAILAAFGDVDHAVSCKH